MPSAVLTLSPSPNPSYNHSISDASPETDPEDRHETEPLLRIRLSSSMHLVMSQPLAGPDSHMVGRRLVNALPWRCFWIVHRILRHPRPTADPAVSPLPPHAPKIHAPLLALASRCQVLMYKVALYHPSTWCYTISGTLFPTSGGRPALPVPSLAAISLLSLL
jgi:hypothetical protein